MSNLFLKIAHTIMYSEDKIMSLSKCEKPGAIPQVFMLVYPISALCRFFLAVPSPYGRTGSMQDGCLISNSRPAASRLPVSGFLRNRTTLSEC